MKNQLNQLILFLAGVLVLCTSSATSGELVNGLVMGKVCWFHLVMPLFSVCVLFVALTQQKGLFRISIPDILLLFFAGITLILYDWPLNPEPEKLLFGGQIVVLWFMLRFVLHAYPSLCIFYLVALMGTALWQAMLGMEQLHGFESSNHSLFRLTGSFFNPGPYSGYLAVVLPVCLGMALRYRSALYYFALICVFAIVVVLPAGMSRSAWIAVAVSCGWVYWVERIGWDQSKRLFIRYRKTAFTLFLIGLVALSGIMGGIYQMKKGSADGRRLMWKITAKAITAQPLTGTGLGGFPAAYAQMQGKYFASGKASEVEKLVAGSPEYAFNEYLQIGLEQGVGGLIVFLLWMGSLFYYGIKSRQIGVSGGILALAIFALSSYPLQLPSFWVVLVFLGAIAVCKIENIDPTTSLESKRDFQAILSKGIVVSLTVASIGLFYMQKDQYKMYEKWNRMQMLYNNKAYEAVVDEYTDLHPKLKHKPEFLFEEAQCLSKTGRYREAVEVLERASQLSADPMLYYMMAKNMQALGHYRDAERLLCYSINLLPERIYPYYLLVKLYAEPAFYNSEKLQIAANAVLTKEPKVNSRAIQEMRKEVEEIDTFLVYPVGETGINPVPPT